MYDKNDNIIGTGLCHADYNVIDFSEYKNIQTTVSKSDTSESVYVYYRNTDNNTVAIVRFSNHTCNGVEFGDYLDGASKDEVLYRLGMKQRKFIPDTRLFIGFEKVKKADLEKYEEAELTIKEMYALGKDADISACKGKLAKGSNYLIFSDKVREFELKTGQYIYY